MTIIFNVLFVFWCVALFVLGLLGAAIWQGTEGEANGGAAIGRLVALGTAGLLAVSLLLRVLL